MFLEIWRNDFSKDFVHAFSRLSYHGCVAAELSHFNETTPSSTIVEQWALGDTAEKWGQKSRLDLDILKIKDPVISRP